MNYKFIVIYSDGPMGASILGSLLEKYGYLNIPIRKIYLSEYVMGIRNLSDKAMQNKILAILKSLSSEMILGGTSVRDRNSRKGQIRALKPSEEEINNFLAFEPHDLHSLISHCYLFAAKNLIYKGYNIPLRGFILYELPQFRKSVDFTQIEYLKRLNKLSNFTCLTMNREFKEWCASLLSQQDYKIKNSLRGRIVSLEKLFNRWEKIQKLSKISNINNIDLNSVLLPNIQQTNNLISKKLKLPKIKEKTLKNQLFDLYGSLLKFDLAFKPADKSFEETCFLNKVIFENYIKFPKIIRFIINIIFNGLRAIGFLKVY